MVKVVAYIRPHRLEAVKSAVSILGISGLTVADARGRGNSEERSRWQQGDTQLSALPIRSRLEVIVQDDLLDSILEAIVENARSEEPGDGKIFVSEVEEAVRIRTGERGSKGL